MMLNSSNTPILYLFRHYRLINILNHAVNDLSSDSNLFSFDGLITTNSPSAQTLPTFAPYVNFVLPAINNQNIYVFPVIICPDNQNYIYQSKNNICKASVTQYDDQEIAMQFSSNNKKLFYTMGTGTLNSYYFIQFWFKSISTSNFEIFGQYTTTDSISFCKSSNTISFKKNNASLISGPLPAGWNLYAFQRTDSAMTLFINNKQSTTSTGADYYNFFNNVPIYFSYSTTEGTILFQMRELLIFNYNITPNMQYYLYTTKPDMRDFDPVIYFKFDDGAETASFINNGNPSKQSITDQSFLTGVALDNDYNPTSKLCPPYMLPMNQNSNMLNNGRCNRISYAVIPLTNTPSILYSSNTCYNEYTVEAFFKFTINNCPKMLVFNSYSTISVGLESNKLSISKSNVYLEQITSSTSTWNYIALRFLRTKIGSITLIMNFNNYRAVYNNISDFTCSSPVTLSLQGSTTYSCTSLNLVNARVYNYALSEGQLFSNRATVSFVRSSTILSSYDQRVFYQYLSTTGSYDSISNTNPGYSITSTVNNFSVCGKNCYVDYTNYETSTNYVNRGLLQFKPTQKLPIKMVNPYLYYAVNAFSIDFWIKFNSCPFSSSTTSSIVFIDNSGL